MILSMLSNNVRIEQVRDDMIEETVQLLVIMYWIHDV